MVFFFGWDAICICIFHFYFSSVQQLACWHASCWRGWLELTQVSGVTFYSFFTLTDSFFSSKYFHRISEPYLTKCTFKFFFLFALDRMQFFFCLCVEKGNATEHTDILQGMLLFVLIFCEHKFSTTPVREHQKTREITVFFFSNLVRNRPTLRHPVTTPRFAKRKK